MNIRFPHFSLVFWVFIVLKSGQSGGETGEKPLFMLAAASLKDALEEGVALQSALHEGRPIIAFLVSGGA